MGGLRVIIRCTHSFVCNFFSFITMVWVLFFRRVGFVVFVIFSFLFFFPSRHGVSALEGGVVCTKLQNDLSAL